MKELDFAPLYQFEDGTVIGRILTIKELLRFRRFFAPHFEKVSVERWTGLDPSVYPLFGIVSDGGAFLGKFYLRDLLNHDWTGVMAMMGDSNRDNDLRSIRHWLLPFCEAMIWSPDFNPYEWQALRIPVFLPDALWKLAADVPPDPSWDRLQRFVDDLTSASSALSVTLSEHVRSAHGVISYHGHEISMVPDSMPASGFNDLHRYDPSKALVLSCRKGAWSLSWRGNTTVDFLSESDPSMLAALNPPFLNGPFIKRASEEEEWWDENSDKGRPLFDPRVIEPYWLLSSPSPVTLPGPSFLDWYRQMVSDGALDDR